MGFAYGNNYIGNGDCQFSGSLHPYVWHKGIIYIKFQEENKNERHNNYREYFIYWRR